MAAAMNELTILARHTSEGGTLADMVRLRLRVTADLKWELIE